MFSWIIGIGLVFVISITYTQGRCHCYEQTVHYEELGCTAEYANSDDCCPNWYNCKFDVRQNGRQCYLGDRVYHPGQRVNAIGINNPCFHKCKCDGVGSVNFKCSQTRCPEETQQMGCYLQYRSDHCCSFDKACYPFNATDTCFDGDRVSLHGEKYSPPNEPCTDCICEQPSNGIGLELVCHRTYCAIELQHAEDVRQHCAPVYDDHQACCPTYWKCPESADRVIRAENGAQQQTISAVCHYGNMNLYVGDTINGLTIDIANIQCECRIPPLVTCVKKPHKTDELIDE